MIALGYGIVSPVMPAFARTFGVSITAVTFSITIFSVSRLCFAPVSGLLVQHLGERRIYIGGLLVVALATIACAFSQTYWQLLVFRAISGIGSTMFFVSALGLMIRHQPGRRARTDRGHVHHVVHDRRSRWARDRRPDGGLGVDSSVHRLRRCPAGRDRGADLRLAEFDAGRTSRADTINGDDARGAAVACLLVGAMSPTSRPAGRCSDFASPWSRSSFRT